MSLRFPGRVHVLESPQKRSRDDGARGSERACRRQQRRRRSCPHFTDSGRETPADSPALALDGTAGCRLHG
eukprot:scaffold184_cov316-Pinguiococcus_pyrenoidosus.AAC.30